MKKILILGLLFVSLFFISCNKIIEEKPYSFLTSKNFPTNEREADVSLFGAYGVQQTQNLFGLYQPFILNMQGDDIFSSPMGNFESISWDGQEFKTYSEYWKGINAANNLISTLETFDGVKNPWATTKLAEARAIRAFYYFILVRFWGDLPIRMKPTNETSLILPRDPVEKIYDVVILPDLIFAEDKLAKVSDGGGRFTSGAVKALLTDVYVTLAGWRRSSQGTMVHGDAKYWTLARDKAKEVIDMEAQGIYKFEPVYSKLFTDLFNDVYNKEIILDVQFSNAAGSGSGFGYFFGVGPPSPGSGGGGGYYWTRPAWAFQENPEDVRFQWNLGSYSFNGWEKEYTNDSLFGYYQISKFQKIYPSTAYWMDYNTNWPLYRLSDIKLLYAEAINEVNGGPTAEAYAQINKIRYRARPDAHKTDGTILPDLAGLNQAQFRQAIMKERATELVLEGKRRFDLIRWGNLIEKVVANLENPPSASGDMLNRFYLFPLPPEDLLSNSWTQNAGF